MNEADRRSRWTITAGNGIFVRLVSVSVALVTSTALYADIYFHQHNAGEHQAALDLRDAVLRLRRDGAFIAVPLFRVNTDPVGPHPVGECRFLLLAMLLIAS